MPKVVDIDSLLYSIANIRASGAGKRSSLDTVRELIINNSFEIDRPQGEWKPKNHHTDYCSNCGFEETQWRTADYNFCPSCGARIKGEDDE